MQTQQKLVALQNFKISTPPNLSVRFLHQATPEVFHGLILKAPQSAPVTHWSPVVTSNGHQQPVTDDQSGCTWVGHDGP